DPVRRTGARRPRRARWPGHRLGPLRTARRRPPHAPRRAARDPADHRIGTDHRPPRLVAAAGAGGRGHHASGRTGPIAPRPRTQTMAQHHSFDGPLIPPGEPVPGKTYRADGWMMFDAPKMTAGLWDEFLGI